MRKPESVELTVSCALYQDDKILLQESHRKTWAGLCLPGGHVEEGESFVQAIIREMKEETGLQLEPLQADPLFETPRFQTIGMTDESCATVYGYASGDPTSALEEDAEDIEVVLADRREVTRILQEEYVSSNCAHHLFHFLSDADPFAFLSCRS